MVRVCNVILFMDLLCVTGIGERMTHIISLRVFACVCGEKDVVLYLSLIHGVVTYVDNWSRVSLGGPYERETKRETVCSSF